MINANEICKNPKHEIDIMICEISKRINVDPIIVASSMTFASIELTANYCDFELSRNYFDATLPLLDNQAKKAKALFIDMYLQNDLPPPGYYGNDKMYCKFNYDLLGPKSKEKFFN